MEAIETTIYKCDHCGKRQFRKCDMTLHERWCKENPNNKHACFLFCANLEKTQESYEGDEFIGSRTVFICKITGNKMYSYKAERRKLPVVYDGKSIRMPLECKDYESMHGYSIEPPTEGIIGEIENWF